MRHHLKQFFIPHEGNNYHPHLLHTKRAVLYSTVFCVSKLLMVLVALSVPFHAFSSPDLLVKEEAKLLRLVNEFRGARGLSPLAPVVALHESSEIKSRDMAANSYFAHRSPAGVDLPRLMNQVGYQYEAAGENLAMGFVSAEEVLRAWVNSPPHAGVLSNPDFTDMGNAFIPGTFGEYATVYVTGHFGRPARGGSLARSAPTGVSEMAEQGMSQTRVQPRAAASPEQPMADVRGEEAFAATIIPEETFVSWQAVSAEDNSMNFHAQAKVLGRIQSADVYVKQHKIPLNQHGDVFVGDLTIQESPSEYFRNYLPPVLEVRGDDGRITAFDIPMRDVRVLPPTLSTQYTLGRNFLNEFAEGFAYWNNLYLFFAAFFFVALVINILVEIRRQHPHVIAQTSAMIVLLIVLALY